MYICRIYTVHFLEGILHPVILTHCTSMLTTPPRGNSRAEHKIKVSVVQTIYWSAQLGVISTSCRAYNLSDLDYLVLILLDSQHAGNAAKV